MVVLMSFKKENSCLKASLSAMLCKSVNMLISLIVTHTFCTIISITVGHSGLLSITCCSSIEFYTFVHVYTMSVYSLFVTQPLVDDYIMNYCMT